MEVRHRDTYPRRPQKEKDPEFVKPFQVSFQERNDSKWRFRLLNVALVMVLLGNLITFFYSPTGCHHKNSSHSVPYLIWGGSDPRYISNLEIDWDEIASITRSVSEKKKHQAIGLLNFNEDEISHWKQLIPSSDHIILQLDYVEKNLTWEALYPEWIDEEQEEEVPVCPSLPKLQVPWKPLNLIAVKLPCRGNNGNWARDVARLHLQLALARLAATSKGSRDLHLVFHTNCFPMPNLFTCKELVSHEGNTWLYKPNLNTLREKVQHPVGSCELTIPLEPKGTGYSGNVHREAYATILHSADVYVCGAIAAAQSIRMSGSKRDLIILVDQTITGYHRSGLEAAGWKVREIQRIRNPKAEKDAYNEWNYSKFRLWQLTDYNKIIFIDADMLILRNIDFLFNLPEVSATGNDASLFNSGVMVVEPSNCTYHLLIDNIDKFESYNGGDQGYLNEIFTWWHRVPRYMNFLKHIWDVNDENEKEMKTRLFGAEPPVLYVLHYLGQKPWLCFRDYDCNWNVDILREFASDVAHSRWWEVHDSMSELLQQFCLLKTKQKAQLEWDRLGAKKANFNDRHWEIKIQDTRKKRCIDNYCSWKNMLRHWVDGNSSNSQVVVHRRLP